MCAIKIRTIQGREVSEKSGFLETYALKKKIFLIFYVFVPSYR